MARIVIEHLMDKLWRWLYIEYVNSIKLFPELVITNLPRKYHNLFPHNNVSDKSVFQLFDISNTIILDPSAKLQLTSEAIRDNDVLVVGGILGAHPPLGRTRLYLTSRFPGIRSYNIGPKQLSIDGAVYVARKIAEGCPLASIKFLDNIKIRTWFGSTIILPYRYPLVGGKPIISKELIKLLKRFGLPNMDNPQDEKIWGDVLALST